MSIQNPQKSGALSSIKAALRTYATLERSKALQRFFKTGPGEYGEGDRFLGVTVPEIRRVAKQFASQVTNQTLKALFRSPFHEERLVGVVLLVNRFKKAEAHSEQQKIQALYLSLRDGVNNWDLVDLSAPYILGGFAVKQADTGELLRLSRSKRHWDRRMAIVATSALIREGDLDLTFELALKFLSETEDLMHKATGWMLREAGKRDPDRLRSFIQAHGRKMPRTMLRYSIEKFSEAERKRILTSTRAP